MVERDFAPGLTRWSLKDRVVASKSNRCWPGLVMVALGAAFLLAAETKVVTALGRCAFSGRDFRCSVEPCLCLGSFWKSIMSNSECAPKRAPADHSEFRAVLTASSPARRFDLDPG